MLREFQRRERSGVPGAWERLEGVRHEGGSNVPRQAMRPSAEVPAGYAVRLHPLFGPAPHIHGPDGAITVPMVRPKGVKRDGEIRESESVQT
jgi:hypothetical protein